MNECPIAEHFASSSHLCEPAINRRLASLGLRFVARLLDGEKMAALCREFDISRKTGYKIFNRYQDCDLEG